MTNPYRLNCAQRDGLLGHGEHDCLGSIVAQPVTGRHTVEVLTGSAEPQRDLPRVGGTSAQNLEHVGQPRECRTIIAELPGLTYEVAIIETTAEQEVRADLCGHLGHALIVPVNRRLATAVAASALSNFPDRTALMSSRITLTISRIGHRADRTTRQSSYAQARFHALLAEIERTGESVTITYRGRPVAVLMPARRHRSFGQLPGMHVPDDFDAPLPEAEIAAWQDNSST